MASPGTVYDTKSRVHALQTRSRLEDCWKVDVNWELYPEKLQQVSKSKLPLLVVMCIVYFSSDR